MRINKTALLRWQQLEARKVLLAIADHAKRDDTFEPTKNRGTTRWYASVGGNEFELLLTGSAAARELRSCTAIAANLRNRRYPVMPSYRLKPLASYSDLEMLA